MPEVWGLLPKSQVDDELIEEAIARLILEHCADETAHLGVGQSLDSHRASEIIDHVVDSIIADKIAPLSVAPEKLLMDKFFILGQFETISAYQQVKTGVGADIAVDCPNSVALTCGDVAGDKTILYISHPILEILDELDPFLQAVVNDDGGAGQDIAIAMGYSDPFTTTHAICGIRYDKTDNKVYGFLRKYSGGVFVEEKIELATTPPDKKIWRVQVNSSTSKIEFYIDNVLINTITYTSSFSSYFSSDCLFAVANRNDDAGSNFGLYIYNLVFSMRL